MKPIKWLDQFLHLVSNFGMTILSYIPILNSLNTANWAISREYYQTKERMRDAAREHGLEHNISFNSVVSFMWQQGDFFKRDLIVSYVGILLGQVAVFTVVWLLHDLDIVSISLHFY